MDHVGEVRTVTTPGGRAVVIGPLEPGRTEELFQIFSQVVVDGEGYPHASPLTRPAFEETWLRPVTAVVGAVIDGHLAGGYYLKPNQPGAGAHIANAGYVVAAADRATGIGRLLVEDSIERAPRAGFDAVQFNFVFESNPARSLYERMGWEVVGRIPDAVRRVDGTSEAALVYWRAVGSPRPTRPGHAGEPAGVGAEGAALFGVAAGGWATATGAAAQDPTGPAADTAAPAGTGHVAESRPQDANARPVPAAEWAGPTGRRSGDPAPGPDTAGPGHTGGPDSPSHRPTSGPDGHGAGPAAADRPTNGHAPQGPPAAGHAPQTGPGPTGASSGTAGRPGAAGSASGRTVGGGQAFDLLQTALGSLAGVDTGRLRAEVEAAIAESKTGALRELVEGLLRNRRSS